MSQYSDRKSWLSLKSTTATWNVTAAVVVLAS